MNRRLPLVHALVVIGILLVLHEGWTGGLIGGGFHPGHAWAVDQVAAMMTGRSAQLERHVEVGSDSLCMPLLTRLGCVPHPSAASTHRASTHRATSAHLGRPVACARRSTPLPPHSPSAFTT